MEKTYHTRCGEIHYWVEKNSAENQITLVFLPGLTADHHLFDQQIPYFINKYNVLTWDAPGHAASRPFTLDFSLMDKAKWLYEILKTEKLENVIIVGQSMGGYVGQVFLQTYPDTLLGFISIDSAPLQRHYMTKAEIWLMKNIEPVYRMYPWKLLVSQGSKGVAYTKYGQETMRKMMEAYNSDTAYYCKLVGHGYQILADAIEADLPYSINCKAVLICGEKDRAGSTKRYNRKWHQETNIPIYWIPDAGHNSNSDSPDQINDIIKITIKDMQAF